MSFKLVTFDMELLKENIFVNFLLSFIPKEKRGKVNIKDKEPIHNRVIQGRVIEFLSILDEILNVKFPDYPDDEGILINRFSFALSDLFKANAVDRPKIGVYQINDGGIDGIINQDPLGTNTVYIQAKRYAEGNKVGRSAIQSFYGALAVVHADRGVFIPTSDY